jgi:Alginate export
MEYGAGRLIDVREGPNVRLSFIGFRLLNKLGAWRFDVFAVRPRLDNFGFFDDNPNHQVGFWGVYGWRPLVHGITVDAYYLGLNRAEATYQRGDSFRAAPQFGNEVFAPDCREGARMGFR